MAGVAGEKLVKIDDILSELRHKTASRLGIMRSKNLNKGNCRIFKNPD